MHKHLLALALLTTGSAQAADFFIRHQGMVAASTISGITPGQPYAITLVLNNDDDNVLGQRWSRYHVQCVLIQTPTTAYAQQLNTLALPVPDGTGSVTTGPAGTLTGMFSKLDSWADNNDPNRPYTNLGLGGLTAPLDWTLDDHAPHVLRDSAGLQFSTVGGAPQAPTQWSNPEEHDGGCTVSPLPAAPPPMPGATPVPMLGEWGVLILAMGLGLFGLQRFPTERKQLSKKECTTRGVHARPFP